MYLYVGWILCGTNLGMMILIKAKNCEFVLNGGCDLLKWQLVNEKITEPIS